MSRCHPVGTKLRCKFSRDGNYHEAEIIGTRQAGEDWEYYVHYIPFDRRMDAWVSSSELAPDLMDTCPSPGNTDAVERNTRKTREPVVGQDETLCPDQELYEKHREESTKIRNFDQLILGKWQIEPWYFSPYSEDIMHNDRRLIVCEWCLKYMRKWTTFMKHMHNCTQRHPPGKCIYNNGSVSVFEVDGTENELYCQLLCLLAKLFLDHKTLFFDTGPFLFYVMTHTDEEGCHLVGYFSKEKYSFEDYNVACILTLPPFQGHGYGRALIEFSYELTKKEQKVGSPERPLSDLGKRSYFSYWKDVLIRLMWEHQEIDIKKMCGITGIKEADIISVLKKLRFYKYYRGEHQAHAPPVELESSFEGLRTPKIGIDASKIVWVPPPPPSRKDLLKARNEDP
mmetsp:Transcript_6383/g.11372  ORF Transcript_6383/g.11372 Transcript_6383/m.11372 type:complete len:397 (-) Transcript_6383:2118-3308(-)